MTIFVPYRMLSRVGHFHSKKSQLLKKEFKLNGREDNNK